MQNDTSGRFDNNRMFGRFCRENLQKYTGKNKPASLKE